MPAGAQKRGGEPARQRFEQRIRAGIVAARREIGVVRAQQIRQGRGRERLDDPNVLERMLRVAGEGDVEFVELEVAVEPRQDVRAFARIVRPARRNDAHASAGERLAGCRWMKDRRIDRIADDKRAP